MRAWIGNLARYLLKGCLKGARRLQVHETSARPNVIPHGESGMGPSNIGIHILTRADVCRETTHEDMLRVMRPSQLGSE